ncbi:hypothetical protein PBY51_019593 [Eleginops maclovinus]|uniref:Uncharacterized protein n=1 Tax=Eleginops maclovinus TaxID=56733 RepID=A0AAN7YBE5_ELEMC|nr:hypothetical protein PBY51_019593 [Eleginops maclovinus]
MPKLFTEHYGTGRGVLERGWAGAWSVLCCSVRCPVRAAPLSVAESHVQRQRQIPPPPPPPRGDNKHCWRSGWIYCGVCCSWKRRSAAAGALQQEVSSGENQRSRQAQRQRPSSGTRDPPALLQPPTAGAQ